jgi:hypothetical protein
MNLRSRYSYVLAAFFIIFIGCSKKSEAPQSSFDLVERLPKNAVAFLSWDGLNPRYKELTDSKWGQMYDLTPTDSIEVNATLKLLKIFNAESATAGIISKGLAFYTVEQEPSLKIDAAYIVTAKSGADFKALKAKLLTELSNQGVTLEKQSIENLGEAFRFQVKDTPQGWPSEFYLFINDTLFTLTSSKALLSITTREIGTDKNSILMDPRYQQYVKDALSRSSFQIGAVNLDAVMPILKESMKAASPGAELSDSPYSLAVMDSGFEKGPFINWDLITRDATGNPDPSTTKNSPNFAQLIPAGSSFSFEISGGIITSLMGGAALPTGMDVTALIKRVAIFVRDGSIGSLVPELSIGILSADATNTKTKVVDLLKNLSNLAQGALSPWQSAKIGQVEVDYTISPIGGFGVYVGNVNGATLVSSSDKIFTYYQDPNQVGESLAKRFQEQGVQSKDSAISGHVDFVKLVSLIDSLKGTASLFAPQANTQDMGIKTDFMKQLGFLSFEIIEQRDRLSGKVIFSE